ncbi:hypothetical protein [Donghicola sp. XS_ASV15]|uniref:hypothetical protein n=1 Tax=Donghicola sp. XS_ASV15 TaxID=3241295 RepID=UPI003511775A
MIRWAAALLAAASPACALDFGDLTPTEREALGQELRALLLDEPELIEQALSPARPDPMSFHIAEDKRRLSYLREQIAPQDGDVVIGPAGAPVVTAFLGAGDTSAEMARVLRDLAGTATPPQIVIKFWPANDRAAAIGQLYGTEALWAALTGQSETDWDEAAIGARAAKLMTDRTALAEALELDAPPFLLIDGIMVKGPVPPIVIQKYLSK